ncbi:C40 family peptidase [Nocardioides ginsengisoli]|uniref:C40 family peptidase n=1 Tax=Nocardioides ginsengisoli TaxID=363868 RepID=A0ABW3VYP1_9ACTN
MRSPSLGTGLLALVLTAGVFVPGAQADPGTPKPGTPGTPTASEVRAAQDRAVAAQGAVGVLQRKLDAANAELDAASVRAAKAAEAWNGARWTAQQARIAAREAATASKAADRALAVQVKQFRDAIVLAHNSGLDLNAATAFVTADGMESLLERSSASDYLQARFDQRRNEYVAAADTAEKASGKAAATSQDAEQALADARVAKDAADAAASDAAVAATAIEARRTRLVARLAKLQGISVRLARKRQDAILLAREERRAAEAAAAAKAVKATPAVAHDPKPDEPRPGDEPAPPADGDGARAAIAYARAQLGKPYVWGADGPNAFDCSGLTSQAWAAGGKSLPHYSVAQYDVSTPISASELRPGDLVFWGDGPSSSSIYHVALYVGNGRIIHAPRTGRPVSEDSMYYWRTPDFYARP